ncbi:MAG: right-handed parallel beta-helix repeat-containing protein [Chloroflexi bacterium]|nr:right-handed parallel beta-helix repeat-containing protein [Chloroflexota bacterium]
MKRGKLIGRIFEIAVVFVMIGAMLGGLPALVSQVEASPATIYVPDDYSTIQAAVYAASPGDTIIVRDGTYTENVCVNKGHFTIRSQNGAEKTIVQAADPDFCVFWVEADYVTIRGFTISNGCDGIELAYSHNNTLADNTVIDNAEDGIELIGSENNILSGNTISNNNGDGIYLSDSSNNNTLVNNMIVSNYHSGILLFRSSNNTIWSNIGKLNNIGISFWESSGNAIYFNNFGENTGGNVGYYDPSTNINTWNSPEKITYTYDGNIYTNFLGNYWSDYAGSDTDGDGIGDTPYPIDSDADNYPLVEPFEN